jgi:signal transduction histidine kinase
MVGGTFKIESQAGQGTLVSAEIPFQPTSRP